MITIRYGKNFVLKNHIKIAKELYICIQLQNNDIFFMSFHGIIQQQQRKIYGE